MSILDFEPDCQPVECCPQDSRSIVKIRRTTARRIGLGVAFVVLLGGLFLTRKADLPTLGASAYTSAKSVVERNMSAESPGFVFDSRLQAGAYGPMDIGVAVVVMLILSAGLYWIGMKIGRGCPGGASVCAVLGTVMFIFWFSLAIHGRLFLARILPFSNVVILGNWLPPNAALLAGIVGGRQSASPRRRLVFAGVLLCLAWCTIAASLVGLRSAGIDAEHPRVVDGVHLQTGSVSCSPCCAATLLGEYGIESSEREMAPLCLTGRLGTPPLGLYRGMRLMTRNTKWKVQIVRCGVEGLRRQLAEPMLIRVRLCGFRIISSGGFGWMPSADHTLVLFGFTEDGRIRVGDPASRRSPRMLWTMEDLERQWNGEGLQLVERWRAGQ